MYGPLKFLYNNDFAHFIRMVSPFICLGVGSALYDRIAKASPCQTPTMGDFTENFHITYWLLFGVVMLFLLKWFCEKFLFGWVREWNVDKDNNYKYLFINPPMIPPLAYIWEYIRKAGSTVKNLGKVASNLGTRAANTMRADEDKVDIDNVIHEMNFKMDPDTPFLKRLLYSSPLYWDMFLDLAKWALSIAALVYASFSLKNFMELNPEEGRFKHDLRNLYVCFITFLIVLFALTIITPYQLSRIFEFIVQWLAPPALLGLTSYLVYITNLLSKLSTMQLIE
jgi:hypothetical protein